MLIGTQLQSENHTIATDNHYKNRCKLLTLLIMLYTTFQWTEDGQDLQIQYLTPDTWSGSWAVLIEIIRLVNRLKIQRGFKESGMRSCPALQLL